MVCEAVPTIACDFSSMPDRLQHVCLGKICVPVASLAFSPRSSVEYSGLGYRVLPAQLVVVHAFHVLHWRV